MDNNQTIYVAFAADENYAQHLGVAMMSLLHNIASDVTVNTTVLGDNLSAESISRLKHIASENNVSIDFPAIDFQNFKDLTVKRHLSRACYSRLALPEIIEGDKVLYLDCDLLVRCDISSLWKTDISDFYSGAVIEPLMNFSHGQQLDHRKKLSLSPETIYFNSGVLLLNLKRCRNDNVMQEAFDFSLRNPDTWCHDQDGLNIAMCNKWLPLHPKWNVQESTCKFFYSSKWRKKFPPEIIETVKDPAILHFTSSIKPWHYVCENPYVEEYYKYLAMTPWKDYRPSGKTFWGMVKKIRRKFKRRVVGLFLGYRV